MLGRLFDCFSLYEAISTHIYKHKEDDTLNKKINSTIFVDGVAYDCIRSMEDHKTELTCRANNLEGAIYAERERQADEKRRVYEEAMRPETFSTATSTAAVFLAGHYQQINIDGRVITANTARRVAAKLVRMADALDGTWYQGRLYELERAAEDVNKGLEDEAVNAARDAERVETEFVADVMQYNPPLVAAEVAL